MIGWNNNSSSLYSTLKWRALEVNREVGGAELQQHSPTTCALHDDKYVRDLCISVWLVLFKLFQLGRPWCSKKETRSVSSGFSVKPLNSFSGIKISAQNY